MDGFLEKIRDRGGRFFSPIAISVSLLIIIILISGILSGCDALSSVKRSILNRFSAEDDMIEAVEVVNEFFNLISDKDYKEAYEYLSAGDKLQGSEEDFRDEFKNVTDIVSINVKWVEVKNNIAVVCVDLTDFYDGEEKVFENIEVSLIREDEGDEWKVVFWN